MKQILLLILICIIGSVSAQNKGIPLTEIENDLVLSERTFDVVNNYMEKNRLTEKEYIDLNIAKCKHPTLRAIPLKSISVGSTIVKTDAGMVRFVYASKKITETWWDENKPKEVTRLVLYIYMFSMTPDGKHIDSLYGGYMSFNPSAHLIPEGTLYADDASFYIRDNKIILVRTEADEECFGEYSISYIITKDLKFKEISK